MKKFTDITKKDSKIEFKKDKPTLVSNDIENLDDQISDEIDGTKLDGEWEIQSVISVSSEPPKTNEAVIVNADLGSKEIKRGEFIYITALINKKDKPYHQSQMGVIKVRVVEIYNTLLVLNSIK
jgi:hypothetical protein